jgi:hypothetical protein
MEYNRERPHSALGEVKPAEFAGRAASPSGASNLSRPALPQGFPHGSDVASAPATASTQIRPRSGRVKKGLYEGEAALSSQVSFGYDVERK